MIVCDGEQQDEDCRHDEYGEDSKEEERDGATTDSTGTRGVCEQTDVTDGPTSQAWRRT